jgi:hypothetical protein
MPPTQQEAGDHTLDNLSRMLADESVSRARALRLLGAALVGGLLASIPGGAKAAPVVCTGDFPQECGDSCCTADEVCCGKGANALCAPAGFTCCGKGRGVTACTPGWTCCKGTGGTGCCPPGTICCQFGGGTVSCQPPDFCETFGHPR